MKNVFISHHHKDDESVDGLVSLLGRKGYQVRNSSIRVKKDNQERLDKGKVSDDVIKRLLRMKMRWAGKFIVIIGKETHSRPWVNWEIELAHQLGRPIVGVYENGLKDKVPVPEALEKYASSIVGWRPDSVISALEGDAKFENPDGSNASPLHGGNVNC